MSVNKQNVGAAIALVFAAAATTSIGAAVVFFPRMVKLANRQALAAGLAMSAGVMVYISLVDIYAKAITGFEMAGHSEGNQFIYTTLAFFAGIVAMMFLNHIVIEKIMGEKFGAVVHLDEMALQVRNVTTKNSEGDAIQHEGENVEPVDQQKDVKPVDHIEEGEISKQKQEVAKVTERDEEARAKVHDQRLLNMGVATAIAIALHNFPEGVVTFVAYMEDPAVGISLAIGIALHNIPEGVCVSLPVYYATGSRWKGFLWGMLSGFSEPLGALIAWGATGGNFSGNTFGILFGIVSGIMTFIAIDELIPTAIRYDPGSKRTTYWFLVGMLFVSVSLMLFSM